VIEDVDTEMYAAIDRAANRASRVVQRHLARSRDAQRTVVADDGALR
jgi:ribosome-associated translation inhibitor RaiA